MNPRPPAPDPAKATAAKNRIRAAKARRDQMVADADRELWQRVADEIAAGNLLQKDAAEELNLTRERIRQQIRTHVPNPTKENPTP